MTDQLRIFAGLQGFVSAAGLLTRLLFFALTTPFGVEQRRWAWLGPVNDWLLLGFVVGGAVVGTAFLLPAESAARMVLFIAGAIPIGLAMIGFPAWWIILASNVR